MQLGVDFREGGKPEKNPRSMGEINCDNSIHMCPKFEIQLGGCTQMFTHPATDPVRPGLTWSLVVKGNALTAYTTRDPLFYTELNICRYIELGSCIYIYIYKV